MGTSKRWMGVGLGPGGIPKLGGLLLVLFTAGCASPEPVEIDRVEPSTPIRVQAPGPEGAQPARVRLDGRFQGYDSERIYLSGPGRSVPDTIPWEDVHRLRVSTGRQIGAGIVLGMWGGFAAGWGALYLINPQAFYGWLYLPVLSVPVGGILGAIFAPESWAPVELPR